MNTDTDKAQRDADYIRAREADVVRAVLLAWGKQEPDPMAEPWRLAGAYRDKRGAWFRLVRRPRSGEWAYLSPYPHDRGHTFGDVWQGDLLAEHAYRQPVRNVYLAIAPGFVPPSCEYTADQTLLPLVHARTLSGHLAIKLPAPVAQLLADAGHALEPLLLPDPRRRG